MVTIKFRTGTDETVANAKIGETLLQAAKSAGVRIVGGCCGAGVCGTCHVLIDKDFMPKMDEQSIEEGDILEILPSRRENSRLACQVLISEDMDGLVVTIP